MRYFVFLYLFVAVIFLVTFAYTNDVCSDDVLSHVCMETHKAVYSLSHPTLLNTLHWLQSIFWSEFSGVVCSFHVNMHDFVLSFNAHPVDLSTEFRLLLFDTILWSLKNVFIFATPDWSEKHSESYQWLQKKFQLDEMSLFGGIPTHATVQWHLDNILSISLRFPLYYSHADFRHRKSCDSYCFCHQKTEIVWKMLRPVSDVDFGIIFVLFFTLGGVVWKWFLAAMYPSHNCVGLVYVSKKFAIRIYA